MAMYQPFLLPFVSRVGSGYALVMCFLTGFEHNYVVNNTYVISKSKFLALVGRNFEINLLIHSVHSGTRMEVATVGWSGEASGVSG